MNHIARRRFAASVARVADKHLTRPDLRDHEFNFREMLKQLILLEDHLVHPYKVCPDCIGKHLLTTEALAEEIAALEPGTIAAETGIAFAELARLWLVNFKDGRPPAEIAIDVRTLRKHMAEEFADPRPSNQRVASRFLSRQCPH